MRECQEGDVAAATLAGTMALDAKPRVRSE
jgi:hypothetical protein